MSTYIYIPLGGNKKGRIRTYINLFLTFLVSGIWHGAAWTFIAWGALHGLIVVIERRFSNLIKKVPDILRMLSTFLFVNLLWVLFRAESFGSAIKIYRGLLNFGDIDLLSISDLTLDGIVKFPSTIGTIYVSIILIVLLFIVFACKNTNEKAKVFTTSKHSLVFSIVLFIISVIHLSRLSVFIYYNF